MNDASTTIPSHRPSITRFQPVVYPSMTALRPIIRNEDILWIRAAYIHNVKTTSSRAVLHCEHWAHIIHHKLDYIEDNVILTGKDHTVCRVAGFYIDIFNNAILSGFNWEFEGFKEDSSFIAIDPVLYTKGWLIDKYYREPAYKMITYTRNAKEFDMRQEDKQWLRDIYEHIVFPLRDLRLLNCTSWEQILYHKLNYVENKEVHTGKMHTVVVAYGVYLDLECNAYLFNFDWKTQSWNENIRVVAINDRFPVRYDLLSAFYAEKALRTTKIHYYHKELS